VECSCCGEERDHVVALQCHEDVVVCRGCVGWLRSKSGVVDTTPILPVRDMGTAVDFYRRAGFDVRRYEDGGYAFVTYEDGSVLDLSVAEPELDRSANRAGCYLITGQADDWYARLCRLGLPVSAFEDEPWGMREFTLTDPDGNSIRVGRPMTD